MGPCSLLVDPSIAWTWKVEKYTQLLNVNRVMSGFPLAITQVWLRPSLDTVTFWVDMYSLPVYTNYIQSLFVVEYEKRDHTARNNISQYSDIGHTCIDDHLPPGQNYWNFGSAIFPLSEPFENIAYRSSPHVTQSLPGNHGYSLFS